MPETLGQALREEREKLNLSLRAVEKRTGISNAHLAQVEGGKIAQPEMAMLWELASLYGIDYTKLLRLAGYGNSAETSGRQRQRTTVALRALGELSPRDQNAALRFMAELKAKKSRE